MSRRRREIHVIGRREREDRAMGALVISGFFGLIGGVAGLTSGGVFGGLIGFVIGTAIANKICES